jgi:hypothetical protein
MSRNSFMAARKTPAIGIGLGISEKTNSALDFGTFPAPEKGEKDSKSVATGVQLADA